MANKAYIFSATRDPAIKLNLGLVNGNVNDIDQMRPSRQQSKAELPISGAEKPIAAVAPTVAKQNVEPAVAVAPTVAEQDIEVT